MYKTCVYFSLYIKLAFGRLKALIKVLNSYQMSVRFESNNAVASAGLEVNTMDSTVIAGLEQIRLLGEGKYVAFEMLCSTQRICFIIQGWDSPAFLV